jgi:subtilisin family serine protease
MATYPPRILMGSEQSRKAYSLQLRQLLLEFDSDAREIGPEVWELLRMQPIDFEQLRSAYSLGPTMRWVNVPAPSEELADYAQSLLEQQPFPIRLNAALPVYFAEGEGPQTAISPLPGKIIVKLSSDDRRLAARVAKSHKLVYDERASELLRPFHQFRIPTDEVDVEGKAKGGRRGEPSRAFELRQDLAGADEVDDAELDWLIVFALALVPSDTHWASQWDMTKIVMSAAWDQQTGGAGVVIAITDSGVDLSHPDLLLTPVATHFNAVEAESGPGPYNAAPDPAYVNGAHGSLVAGIAAAVLNNGLGVAGVAGGCSILPVRVFPNPSNSRLAAGINWSVANGARVINMSWGGGAPSALISTAINNAWAAGVVLCAATGNQYGAVEAASIPVIYPATLPNCIAVGATDQNDQRKRQVSADGEQWASHWGPEIDVVAPGVRLWSTDIQGTAGWNSNNGGPMSWQGVSYPSCGDGTGDYFALMGGTSGATPHVSGLAALLMLKYPALTNQQVRDIIERTCDKVNPATYPYANDAAHPNGSWHQQVGYGRINASAALTYTDVMIADHSVDTGAVPSSALSGGSWVPQPFWTYQPFVTTASNPGATPVDHVDAVAGQNNYVHAVIRNNGPAVATSVLVKWHIMDYPGTELIYPTDFNVGNLIASTTVGPIAVGAEVPVEALWPQANVDIAAGFVHPCMVVLATCGQDVGGQLGSYVYQYNNIAQHNISVGPAPKFSLGLEGPWMPFAIGNPASRARSAVLVFDTSRLKGARAYLDLDPDPEDFYVRRMIDRNKAAGQDHRGCCAMTLSTDARVLVTCAAYSAELTLKAGSSVILPCGCGQGGMSREDLRLTDASWTRIDNREFVALDGGTPRIALPLTPGLIVPVAMRVIPPEAAGPGDSHILHATQVSEGVPTGGVTLRVEVR